MNDRDKLIDSILELRAQNDKLKEINAELLEALETIIKESNRGTSGRLIIDIEMEEHIIAKLSNAKSL
jgi:hypothetical protein